jgi:multidrug transporter EmrE-like cation transporter
MRHPISAIAVVVLMAAVTAFGDYLLKVAGQTERIRSSYVVAGALVYALTALGWAYAMRHLQLAVIGAVFAACMVLFMALLGAIVFDESLSRLELVGVACALASVLLLSRFAG